MLNKFRNTNLKKMGERDSFSHNKFLKTDYLLT